MSAPTNLHVGPDPRVQRALEAAVYLGEIGVQVAAYVGDLQIVDQWIGVADTASARPVDANTLFPIFSTTKAVTATALHLQAERGLVDYDSPVSRYWPEYGAKGKKGVTLRHVLTHRSGVPQMPPGVNLDRVVDWDWMVEHLSQLELLNPPGAKSTYMALSFGWLIGQVVRRTDPRRRAFGRFVKEELCDPLHLDDLYLGLPPELESRVATLYPDDYYPASRLATKRDLVMPPSVDATPAIFNLPLIHQACIPSANGIASARSLARLFALLAGRGAFEDIRLLSEDRVLSFTVPRSNPDEQDEFIGMAVRIGSGAYYLAGREPVVGSGSSILYGSGAGGTVAWADLDSGLAVAICHNRMFRPSAWGGPLAEDDHPFTKLGDAVREVAAEAIKRRTLPTERSV